MTSRNGDDTEPGSVPRSSKTSGVFGAPHAPKVLMDPLSGVHRREASSIVRYDQLMEQALEKRDSTSPAKTAQSPQKGAPSQLEKSLSGSAPRPPAQATRQPAEHPQASPPMSPEKPEPATPPVTAEPTVVAAELPLRIELPVAAAPMAKLPAAPAVTQQRTEAAVATTPRAARAATTAASKPALQLPSTAFNKPRAIDCEIAELKCAMVRLEQDFAARSARRAQRRRHIGDAPVSSAE